MPAIASTGAMLLSGHRKHQFEVGLDLPNLIGDRVANRVSSRQVFGASDRPRTRSTAFIEPVTLFTECALAFARLFAFPAPAGPKSSQICLSGTTTRIADNNKKSWSAKASSQKVFDLHRVLLREKNSIALVGQN